MHSTYIKVLLSGVLLIPSTYATVSTTIYEICTTRYGTKSVRPVPSTTNALTLAFHPTCRSVLTPVTTVTPAPITFSTTVFTTSTTTEPVVTDTYSSTSTETDISTVEVTPTSTFTNTITTTTTLPTPTSTVPTSPGFVPVASATAQFNARRRRDVFPRSLAKPIPKNKCSVNTGGQVSYSPAHFPTAVTCAGLVEVFSTTTIASTGKTTATQTAITPIVTATVTNQIVVTEYPVDASTTLTFSTNIIETTTVTDAPVTSTVSTTLTVSVTPAQATFYAACDTNNEVNQVNGYGIDEIDYVGNLGVVGDGNTSPYDCCVACITDPNCGASFDIDGLCQVIYPQDTCGGGNVFAGYYYGDRTAGLTPAQGFTVSDGNCGQASSNGNT